MTPEYKNGDDWIKWANYVLENIKELKADVRGVRDDVSSIKLDLKGLKVRMGMIGGLAGAVITFALNIAIRLITK